MMDEDHFSRTSIDWPISEPSLFPGRHSGASEQSSPESLLLKPKTDRKTFLRNFDDSWLWEIGSAALSVCGISLLVGFLLWIHDTRYASWQYTISPNAIVSVMMTITEGAMLVAVSSCLSQLKWTHYSEPTPLYTMQAIDEASRGSWGSFQLLCRSLRQTKLGPLLLLGASMRLLSLAIGPFTQQILSFPTSLHATNQTAWIQATDEYISPDLIVPNLELQQGPETHYLDSAMTKALINGLMQTAKPLAPYCGSTKCDFPQFVSMGICSHCADVTAQAHRSCEVSNSVWPLNLTDWQKNIMTNCTYTTPIGYQLNINLRDLVMGGEFSTAQYSADLVTFNVSYWGTVIGNLTAMKLEAIISLLAVDLPMTLVTYNPENVTTMMPMATLTECSLYYCEKQYSPISYSPGQQENFQINVLNTQSLIPIYDEAKPSDDGNYGVVELRSSNGTTKLSENSSYYIDGQTVLDLAVALAQTLNFTYYQTFFPVGYMGLPKLINRSDIGLSLESMSNGLTDTLRQNIKGHMIPGQGYDFETFIEVRWLWIILPVCAVLGTVLLLLGTVFANKRQHMILLKSSVIPLLAAQVQTSPEHDIASLQNLGEMNRMAKAADVTMDQSKGFLVFIEKEEDGCTDLELQCLKN